MSEDENKEDDFDRELDELQEEIEEEDKEYEIQEREESEPQEEEYEKPTEAEKTEWEIQEEEDEIRGKKLQLLDLMLDSLKKEENLEEIFLAIQENTELKNLVLEYFIAIQILAKLQADKIEISLEVGKDLFLTRLFRFWKKEKEIDFEQFGTIHSSGESD